MKQLDEVILLPTQKIAGFINFNHILTFSL